MAAVFVFGATGLLGAAMIALNLPLKRDIPVFDSRPTFITAILLSSAAV